MLPMWGFAKSLEQRGSKEAGSRVSTNCRRLRQLGAMNLAARPQKERLNFHRAQNEPAKSS